MDVAAAMGETRPLFSFDNSYARLPERFFARLPPVSVASPRLVRLNVRLARQLGLDPELLASPAGVEVLAGNRVPDGATPIALAYAGHQFGNWAPQLGDGRAVLLGEITATDGTRFDVQLKGAGRTPFSRGGDGRAALGPVLREYLISEAMAALGIPTTRSLAAVTTGEKIARERLLPGAVLTRIARGHVRVGTFEYFASRGDTDAVRALADYVIARLYPQAAETAEPYRALLDAVIARTAELIAHWMLVGFIHGVMNTDNMSVAGETIDYGPCAFMDTTDPATVFSSIDHAGRYAYGNQPRIAHWNLARLAQSLLPLLGENEASAVAAGQSAIDAFPDSFGAAYVNGLRAKLGLSLQQDGDSALAQELLDAMAANRADFTLTFRRLADSVRFGRDADETVRSLFEDPTAFDRWAVTWRERLAQETISAEDRAAAMRAANPAFIPRNHRVEAALAAAEQSDLSLFDEMLAVLSAPYDDHPEHAHLALPPQPHEIVQATFCGT